MNVLILGGYGVFGGRLAGLLAKDGHTVKIAGRSFDKARTFASRIGASPLELDGSDSNALSGALDGMDVVIDASGPFQTYREDPYSIARAAMASGCHYLDLSDDAAFTAGIAALDAEAKERGVVVLSGLSSVPAFSAAAVHQGTKGLADVALIESAILPGNRAPRGLSVMRAILSQAGEPLTLWRGGMWRTTHAWTRSKRIRLPSGGSPHLSRRPHSSVRPTSPFFRRASTPVRSCSVQALNFA